MKARGGNVLSSAPSQWKTKTPIGAGPPEGDDNLLLPLSYQSKPLRTSRLQCLALGTASNLKVCIRSQRRVPRRSSYDLRAERRKLIAPRKCPGANPLASEGDITDQIHYIEQIFGIAA